MVDGLNNTHKVRSGDCPWNVAKDNLRSKGGKVTNSEIVKEMNRLAKLNGCDSVDDFSEKFFFKIGSEFVVDKKEAPAETPKRKPTRPPEGESREVAPADSTRVARRPINRRVPVRRPGAKKPAPAVPRTAEEKEVARINSMQSDTERIVEYNKKNYDGKYYGIVDKKTCKLNIYDKAGNIVKTLTVGVGKSKGDNLQTGYVSHDSAKKEGGRYTTPGEFVLDEYSSYSNENYISKKDGKHKVMDLKGDNRGDESGQTAIHMIPNHRQERVAAMQSETTADNRMSYGCVNLTEDDYNVMAQYLGEGNKIFILPEEKGNKLQLEKQKDGTYKFEQQYHKDQKRGVSKEVASRVRYDIRPENNPRFIAEQKRKKAEQERLLAEQQKKQEEFSLFRPSTWFS